MNRWVLRRYTATTLWLRTRTDHLADRLAPRTPTRSDRGQTAFEYLGIAVVIAVIIGVLATTSIGTKIEDAIVDQINKIAGKG
jgi:Flp pilus assembly pilin Flp